MVQFFGPLCRYTMTENGCCGNTDERNCGGHFIEFLSSLTSDGGLVSDVDGVSVAVTRF